jgi:hypothetical protein
MYMYEPKKPSEFARGLSEDITNSSLSVNILSRQYGKVSYLHVQHHLLWSTY